MPNTVVTLLKGCAEGMCGHVGAVCGPMECMNRVTHEHPEAQDVAVLCIRYTTLYSAVIYNLDGSQAP
jgi:hypothetical protein